MRPSTVLCGEALNPAQETTKITEKNTDANNNKLLSTLLTRIIKRLTINTERPLENTANHRTDKMTFSQRMQSLSNIFALRSTFIMVIELWESLVFLLKAFLGLSFLVEEQVFESLRTHLKSISI